MADVEHKMPLGKARLIADALVKELRPGCERIEIAGSIRREKPEIGDIEIVAIPKVTTDLLGEPLGSALDPILDRLCDEKRLHKIKGGEKYKQYIVVKQGCKLDLFLPTVETWGCVFTVRTGSAEFSHRLVTPKSQGGLCPDDMRFREGRLVRNLATLTTREEADVFREVGLTWIEPKNR